jgi:membrane carboxypeptidase/penicillin-binding protein
MGYQQGEIPMLDVHGEAVAGATFPVPIWHEYMTAVLWKRPALQFLLPDKYPSWHPIKHGDYGSLGYVYTAPTYTSPTTTTSTTTATTTVPATTTQVPVTPTPSPSTPTTTAASPTQVPPAPPANPTPPPAPPAVPPPNQ